MMIIQSETSHVIGITQFQVEIWTFGIFQPGMKLKYWKRYIFKLDVIMSFVINRLN